jgi:hypothetical protein
MAKNSKDLREREILALAILLEEGRWQDLRRLHGRDEKEKPGAKTPAQNRPTQQSPDAFTGASSSLA